MEITVKKTVEEKHEITLPAYYKTNCHHFKIFSNEKCINVCSLLGHRSIGEQHAEAPFNCYAVECTENEFNDAFIQVSQELKNLIKQ